MFSHFSHKKRVIFCSNGIGNGMNLISSWEGSQKAKLTDPIRHVQLETGSRGENMVNIKFPYLLLKPDKTFNVLQFTFSQ